jgi:hypothetical protein
MGANAQTSVPAFTAGQVLTAAEMTEVNTGIAVFADTTARDAAFGGSGEKVLAEGQFAYIEATKTTQYYDGAAWVAVGASGLSLITAQTFSAVTSFSLPTGTFSSTYANYRLIIDITAASATTSFTGRMRASGTDNSTANYNTMMTGVSSAGGGLVAAGNALTSFVMGDILAAAPVNAYSFDIIAPNLARYTDFLGNMATSDATRFIAYAGGMSFAATTAFDSFSFIVAGGANITGDYRVYGYANS